MGNMVRNNKNPVAFRRQITITYIRSLLVCPQS